MQACKLKLNTMYFNILMKKTYISIYILDFKNQTINTNISNIKYITIAIFI